MKIFVGLQINNSDVYIVTQFVCGLGSFHLFRILLADQHVEYVEVRNRDEQVKCRRCRIGERYSVPICGLSYIKWPSSAPNFKDYPSSQLFTSFSHKKTKHATTLANIYYIIVLRICTCFSSEMSPLCLIVLVLSPILSFLSARAKASVKSN